MINWRQKETAGTSPNSQGSGVASVSLRRQTSTIPVGDELGTSEGLIVGVDVGETLEKLGDALGLAEGLVVGLAVGEELIVGVSLGAGLDVGVALGA